MVDTHLQKQPSEINTRLHSVTPSGQYYYNSIYHAPISVLSVSK